MLNIEQEITVNEDNFELECAEICTLRVDDILTVEENLSSDGRREIFRAVSNRGYSYVIKKMYCSDECSNKIHLKSPHITLYFGKLKVDETEYFVYECLETSLDKHLDGGRSLTDRERDIIFLASLRGLKAFVEKGLYYSDLKPANIAISLNNDKITAAKLCDFDAMYEKIEATERRCTPAWGSPAAFADNTNLANIVGYPLGMLLFFLYSGENFWAFITHGNCDEDNKFEQEYILWAQDAHKREPQRTLISGLWHDSRRTTALHSNYDNSKEFRKRISELLPGGCDELLVDIICKALEYYGYGMTPTNLLDELENEYNRFAHRRDINSRDYFKSEHESIVVIDIRRNDMLFETQCFYIASGESINIPVCSFERDSDRVIRGKLFFSSLEGEVFYCINGTNAELCPLSDECKEVEVDGINLYISVRREQICQ